MSIGSARDDENGTLLTRQVEVGVAVVTLVANHGARRVVRACIDLGREHGAVSGVAAGQVECDGKAVVIRFQMDFRSEPAARPPSAWPVCPPLRQRRRRGRG